MRRVVLAALAAVVGFGLYLFWAGGRGVATSPASVAAPETVTETTPAEAAAGVATKAAAAGTAAEQAGGAIGAAGGRELETEIRGLVNQAVKGQGAPAAGEPAPDS